MAQDRPPLSCAPRRRPGHSPQQRGHVVPSSASSSRHRVQTAHGPWRRSDSLRPRSTASAKPKTPLCANSQIAISDPGGGAGIGHEDQLLVFTNRSANAGTLAGYPGVAALNSAGQLVVQARRMTGGYMGGLGPEDTSIPVVFFDPIKRLLPSSKVLTIPLVK